MKLSCYKENLAYGLNAVRNVANTKTSLPVTQNILLETETPDTLKLSTTNLQMTISVSIPGVIEEDGQCCVSARIFNDFIQSLPNERIDMQWDSPGAFLQLQCEGESAKLACINAAAFPPMPIVPNGIVATLEPQDFRTAIKKVAFAAAREESRPILNGVFFNIQNDHYTFAAADGFRLSVLKGKLPAPVDSDFTAVVPVKTLTELERIIAPIYDHIKIAIAPGENRITFMTTNLVVTSQLLQGSFPEYEKLIPTTWKTRSVFPANHLTRAVKTATVFAKTASSNSIRMIFTPITEDGALPYASVFTEISEAGISNSRVELKELEGEPAHIAFNANYLQEMLNVLSADVILEMNDHNQPGLFTLRGDNNYRHIIMPMYVNWSSSEIPPIPSDVPTEDDNDSDDEEVF